MGYLITTTTPKLWQGVDYGGRDVARRAVATLDEAHHDVHMTIAYREQDAYKRVARQGEAKRIVEEGGTITLSDGTTIEVTPHEYAGQVA